MTTSPGTPLPLARTPGCVPDIDQTAPNAARIYDWLLGGQDHYDADQQAGCRLLHAAPEARQAARAHRAFQVRAVRWLARQGITQFIDIGSGLPSVRPVHEAARQVRPDARVAYVDDDPAAVAHARALLNGIPGVTAVQADLRRPRDLLTRPGLRQVIDLTRPAAVLLTGVLHLIPDTDDPAAIVQAITGRLAPPGPSRGGRPPRRHKPPDAHSRAARHPQMIRYRKDPHARHRPPGLRAARDG